MPVDRKSAELRSILQEITEETEAKNYSVSSVDSCKKGLAVWNEPEEGRKNAQKSQKGAAGLL